MKKTLMMAVITLMMAFPAAIQAQHSDIEFGQDGFLIFLDDHAGEEGTMDGARIYESEFPTSGLSQNFTSDPGFASELSEGLGGFTPGSAINLNFIISPSLGGALQYYDGTGFASSGGASILVEDNSPGGTTDLMITEGGFAGDNPQFLQLADGIGDIHSHVDFTLSAGAPVGAYGLLLFMSTDDPVGLGDSDPFWIVFNHGLPDHVFEGRVLRAFGAVPEPSSFALLFGGVCAVAMRRRPKRA